jgi:hypothetical protein
MPRTDQPGYLGVSRSDGGGTDAQERHVREAFEETGLKLSPESLIDPIWRRRAVLSFDGQTFDAEELGSTEDTVYPVQLAELLPSLTADWDGRVRTVR